MTRHLNLDEQADLQSVTTQILADGSVTASKISALDTFDFTLDVSVGQRLIVVGGTNAHAPTISEPDPRAYLDFPKWSFRPEFLSANPTDNFLFPNAISAASLTIAGINPTPQNGNVTVPAGGAIINGSTSLIGNGGSSVALTVSGGTIDFSLGQVLHFRVENLSTTPALGNPGHIYWDTSTKQLFVDNGTAFVPIGSGSSAGVASISSDANPSLTGSVEFMSGSGISLVQVGQAITINATSIGTLTPANFVTRETPAGFVNGSNTVFTLAFLPVIGTEEVYVNGLQQDPGAGNDYTISGQIITFAVAPVLPDKIRVSYIK